MASVPAMLWKADRNRLSLFALNSKGKPKAETTLYRAPFFNVYEDGNVCMGTVETDFSEAENIEEFMQQWERAFWESYFSRSEEHTSELQSLMRISYAVFCLKKKKKIIEAKINKQK